MADGFASFDSGDFGRCTAAEQPLRQQQVLAFLLRGIGGDGLRVAAAGPRALHWFWRLLLDLGSGFAFALAFGFWF